jgi:putative transposase
MRNFRGPRGREESPRKRSNRKRHRPEEVVAKLRQADESLAKGTPIAEGAKLLELFEMTLHRWRAEYGAVDRDAVRRMTELEKENARLKRLVAEKELDILILSQAAMGNSEPDAAASTGKRVTDLLRVSQRQVRRVVC